LRREKIRAGMRNMKSIENELGRKADGWRVRRRPTTKKSKAVDAVAYAAALEVIG